MCVCVCGYVCLCVCVCLSACLCVRFYVRALMSKCVRKVKHVAAHAATTNQTSFRDLKTYQRYEGNTLNANYKS